MRKLFTVAFMLVAHAVWAQHDTIPRPPRLWEVERARLDDEKKAREDSIAMIGGRFVPKTTLSIKSQFPIQQALGLEIMTPAFVSFYIGYGQFSRFYTVVALDALPNEREDQAARRQFIKDKLKNGRVLELGCYYHLVNKKGLYLGLNFQFQRFSMPSTPIELVEEYNFGDPDNFSEDIQDLIDNNGLVRSFYESTIIEPVVRPIQLSFMIGKRFRFKNTPRLGLHTELSYQFNLHTGTSVESPSLIGNILVNSFIDPILENRSDTSFDGFNLPTLAVRLSYSLGKILYKP